MNGPKLNNWREEAENHVLEIPFRKPRRSLHEMHTKLVSLGSLLMVASASTAVTGNTARGGAAWADD
jgi:hypothetical protein